MNNSNSGNFSYHTNERYRVQWLNLLDIADKLDYMAGFAGMTDSCQPFP
jgi:hypothetical protein